MMRLHHSPVTGAPFARINRALLLRSQPEGLITTRLGGNDVARVARAPAALFPEGRKFRHAYPHVTEVIRSKSNDRC